MTNEKVSIAERQCVLPSDIIDWILAYQKQLATILNTDEKIDGKYAIDESITLKTEADKIKGLISMFIQKESTEDKTAFCKKAERLLKNTTNDDNKELLQEMFYDKKGEFMLTNILLGIQSNTYQTDLDRQYLAKNATEIYDNHGGSNCSHVNIFIDNKTKHIVSKQRGGLETNVFPQCENYNPEEHSVIPIDSRYGVFSGKDSHILIRDKQGKGNSYQQNIIFPIQLPETDIATIKYIKFTDETKKTVKISFKDHENNPSRDADLVLENDIYTFQNIRESAFT